MPVLRGYILLLVLAAGDCLWAGESVTWITDYGQALRTARREQKMVLFYFHSQPEDENCQRFETETLANSDVLQALGGLVVAKVPIDAKIKLAGQSVGILEHPSFRMMLGRSGIAIVDFEHAEAPYYGHVVSACPFDPGPICDARQLQVMLALPAGTLTQRTMIFAVRIHPEHPASANGQFVPLLAREAEGQSRYQAQIRLQGHHHWDRRFREISAQLPSGLFAQEVVAESWPGETLVEAAIECVYSWRRSPGHWSAVRASHRMFGYDMKRGTNGIWYATGLFSQHP